MMNSLSTIRIIRYVRVISVLVLFATNLYSQRGIILNSASSFSNGAYVIHSAVGMPVIDYKMAQNTSFHIGAATLFYSDKLEELPCVVRGIVHTNDSLLDDGLVFLIDSITKNVIDTAEVQSGIFNFTQINVGTYYLYAQPFGSDANHFQSTYYVGKTTIEDATPITIHNEVTEIGSLDIYLVPSNNGKNTHDLIIPVQVYPNPFTDVLFIQIYSNDNSQAYYSISEIRGTVLIQKQLTLEKGNYEYELDVEHLSADVYFLKIQSAQNKQVVKMLVKR